MPCPCKSPKESGQGHLFCVLFAVPAVLRRCHHTILKMNEKKKSKILRKKTYNSTPFGLKGLLQRAGFCSCPKDSIDVVDVRLELERVVIRSHCNKKSREENRQAEVLAIRRMEWGLGKKEKSENQRENQPTRDHEIKYKQINL